MTLQQLMFFVTLCETNNYNEAAERLGIYQSNLSYGISELESSLGETLLIRSKKGVYPNAYGQAVYEHSKEAIRLVNECSLALQEKTNERKTSIAIGYSKFFGLTVVRDIIKAVDHECTVRGDVLLNLYIPNNQKLIEEQLLSHQVDIAIMFDSDDIRISKIPILEDDFLLELPAGHRLADKNVVNFEELAGEPLVIYDDGNNTKKYIELLCNYYGMSMKQVNIVQNYRSADYHVMLNGCVSIISKLIKKPEFEETIRYVHLKHVLQSRKIYLAYPYDIANEPIIRMMKKLVLKAAAEICSTFPKNNC